MAEAGITGEAGVTGAAGGTGEAGTTGVAAVTGSAGVAGVSGVLRHTGITGVGSGGAELGVTVLPSGQGWGVAGSPVFSLDSWFSSMVCESQLGISMDISGPVGGVCSWLLRSEEMAGLTVMVGTPTLGSFVSLALLVSQPWIWSLHQPSYLSTVSPGCSSQAGGSGSSWPMFTHGCCQTSSKVPLLVGLSVNIRCIKCVMSFHRYLGT